MGGCLVIFVSAWTFVRELSVPAAVALCFLAMFIPPMAAIVGNTRDKTDRWWDDPPEDAPSDSEKWLDELDHRKDHGRTDRARYGEKHGAEQGGRSGGKPPPGPGTRQ